MEGTAAAGQGLESGPRGVLPGFALSEDFLPVSLRGASVSSSAGRGWLGRGERLPSGRQEEDVHRKCLPLAA